MKYNYDLIQEILYTYEQCEKQMDDYPQDLQGFIMENPIMEKHMLMTEKTIKALMGSKIWEDISWYIWESPRDNRFIEIWGKKYPVKNPQDMIAVMKKMYE